MLTLIHTVKFHSWLAQCIRIANINEMNFPPIFVYCFCLSREIERTRNRGSEWVRKRCDWLRNFGTVWVCVHLQIPLTIRFSHDTPTGLLSAPPTGGALVLGGICVTNFTLSPLPTRCFSVSQSDVWTKDMVSESGWDDGTVAIGNLDTNTMMTQGIPCV